MTNNAKKLKGMTPLFWGGVTFTVLAPVLIGLKSGDASTTWVAALCGAFVTFMARLDVLAELSLGPVKAKMRETIAEANATISQLREVATTMATAVLTDMMAGNFMSGMTLAKRLKLHDELMDGLQKVGSSELQMQQAEAEWRKGITVIYHRIIGAAIRTAGRDKRFDDPTIERNAREFQALLDFENWSAPRPVDVETFCQSRDLLTPDVRAWIDDYRHFLEKNEIRRRVEFENG